MIKTIKEKTRKYIFEKIGFIFNSCVFLKEQYVFPIENLITYMHDIHEFLTVYRL